MSGNNATLRLGLIGAGPWGGNFINTIDGLDGVTLFRFAAAIALGMPDVDDLELGLDVVRTLARLEETLIPGK